MHWLSRLSQGQGGQVRIVSELCKREPSWLRQGERAAAQIAQATCIKQRRALAASTDRHAAEETGGIMCAAAQQT